MGEYLQHKSRDSAAEHDDYLMALGARVRERRAQQRLSRRALSELSGVSERFIAHLESGEGNISIMRLKAIADALDVSVAQFLADRPMMVSQEYVQPAWRSHPGAIAELYRYADPSRQKAIVDILIGTLQNRRAA